MEKVNFHLGANLTTRKLGFDFICIKENQNPMKQVVFIRITFGFPFGINNWKCHTAIADIAATRFKSTYCEVVDLRIVISLAINPRDLEAKF